jgi:hypothetical protein
MKAEAHFYAVDAQPGDLMHIAIEDGDVRLHIRANVRGVVLADGSGLVMETGGHAPTITQVRDLLERWASQINNSAAPTVVVKGDG